MTRRDFLSFSTAGAATLAAGGCASAAPGAGRHRLPVAPRAPARSAVHIVHPSHFATLAASVEAAIEGAGGLGFVKPGESVLIKPAVNSGTAYPATTDPEVALVVARLVLEAGGRPFIADRTMFLRSTAAAFRKTGIDEAARQAGVPCLPLDDAEVVALAHPLAAHWSGRTVNIYRPAAEADHIINLCTPRTHRLGDFTMAMKNNVGLVAGSTRMAMHGPGGLRERLAEISLVTRPALVVLDGRRGFTDGGPDAGALATLDFIAAGRDPLAIDAVGLAHLRLAGANPTVASGSIWALPMMRRAVEIGIGVGAPGLIRLTGLGPIDEGRLRHQMA